MNTSVPAYGLWSLVVINSAVFLLFAYSFTMPRTRLDWSAFGAFAAFVIALFVEMYGFPLTIYLLAAWLGGTYPQLDPLSHDAGHLWLTLLGWKVDPHRSPVHLLGAVLIVGGFILLSASWRTLYAARSAGELACRGSYARVRHPQYVAFLTIMLGFLLQWPTLVTLVMFPVLAAMYVRLGRREELETRAAFGVSYDRYAALTPAWLPRPSHRPPGPPSSSSAGVSP